MALESSRVTVFPCVQRTYEDGNESSVKAKLLSEENITNIIKSITDNKSYIIDWQNNTLEMVIDGYYFKIENQTQPQIGDLYASIEVEKSGNYNLLKGDSDNNFSGLTISNKPSSEKYLKLCEDGKILESSKVKFTRESMGLKMIECGILE